MNILILSWRGPGHPNEGGAERVTFEHAKGWSDAGYEVTLFTSEYPNAKKREYRDGIEIIRRGGYVFGVKLYAFIWYFFKKHKKYDLVVDEFHGIPFFTPLYVKASKLAFIHEVAGQVWRYNPWPKPYNLLPAIIGPIIEKFIFRLYKNIPFMTVSDSTKEDLIAKGIVKKNITVIQNGIKPPKIKSLSFEDKRKVLIFLGALAFDKGVEEAIKVFAEVARKDYLWEYWVVGKGTPEYINKLKNHAKYLNILNNIRFWGFVSEQKKYELLRKAMFLVNTSFHEGWGLVNIEANSVGTPVVGYDVHGTKDSVINGNTGILVTSGDYRGLAENIIKLSLDKNKYLNMQKRAISWSQKFTWQKSKKESLHLIEKI